MAANDGDPGPAASGLRRFGRDLPQLRDIPGGWGRLSESQKDAFKRRMPFYRTGMPQPTVNGYLLDDKTYSAGSRAPNRASVRAY